MNMERTTMTDTRQRGAAELFRDEEGASTAEYAIVTLAVVVELEHTYAATHCDSR